jgi:hypothetical protein
MLSAFSSYQSVSLLFAERAQRLPLWRHSTSFGRLRHHYVYRPAAVRQRPTLLQLCQNYLSLCVRIGKIKARTPPLNITGNFTLCLSDHPKKLPGEQQRSLPNIHANPTRPTWKAVSSGYHPSHQRYPHTLPRLYVFVRLQPQPFEQYARRHVRRAADAADTNAFAFKLLGRTDRFMNDQLIGKSVDETTDSETGSADNRVGDGAAGDIADLN